MPATAILVLGSVRVFGFTAGTAMFMDVLRPRLAAGTPVAATAAGLAGGLLLATGGTPMTAATPVACVPTVAEGVHQRHG